MHAIPHPFPIHSTHHITLTYPNAIHNIAASGATAPHDSTLDDTMLDQSIASLAETNHNNMQQMHRLTLHDSSSNTPTHLSIITRLTPPHPSLPDPNPTLFSSLSHLEEPKPLCWYNASDEANETHYFVEGDVLMGVWCVNQLHASSLLSPDAAQDEQHPHSQSAHVNSSRISNATSISAPTTPIPKLLLLTFSKSTLSHELYLLDYIREKQEMLTGDFYFKKLDAFEDLFGGVGADKVLMLQKGSHVTLCFLLNHSIVGFALDVDANGKMTYLFRIPGVHAMEMVRCDDGREIMVVLQYQNPNVVDLESMHLALYDERYCLGQFDLKAVLERSVLEGVMSGELGDASLDGSMSTAHRDIPTSDSLLHKIIGLERIEHDSDQSTAPQLSVGLKLRATPPHTLTLNLQHLPPQTQLMQDIFQVLYHVLPLELFAHLHHDFIWMRNLFNEDVARQRRAQHANSFNTQKEEWEFFFMLCCLNLGQDHLCFSIEQSEQQQGTSESTAQQRRTILNQLLSSSSGAPSLTPILLSTQNDLSHLKSQLKTLQHENATTTFIQHSRILLLSLHLLFDSYRAYDASVSVCNQRHLLSILTLLSRALDVKNYTLYYTCTCPLIQDESHQNIFNRIRPLTMNSGMPAPKSPTSGLLLFSPAHLQTPPSIFQFLSNVARAARSGQRDLFTQHEVTTTTALNVYPFIRQCAPLELSRKLCRIYWNAFVSLCSDDVQNQGDIYSDIYSPATTTTESSLFTSSSLPMHERIVLMMTQEQINLNELQKIGFGISAVLYDAIVACKKSPRSYWPSSVYSLIGRKDILQLISVRNTAAARDSNTSMPGLNEAFIDTEAWTYYDFSDDNIEQYNDDLELQKHLQRFLHYSNSGGTDTASSRGIGYHVFQDKRLDQVWAMLSSSCALRQGVNWCCSKPGNLLLANSTGAGAAANATDNEQHLQMQNQLKQQLVIQILSRTVARGLLLFSTRTINTTENIHIPPIVLKASLKRSRVNVDLSDQLQELMLLNTGSLTGEPQQASASADPLMWPSFHNGASQAFSIVGANTDDTHQQHITREWIVFHSPRKPTPENAGMLLALGIQGHLNALDLTDIYHCLRAQHELTSIAVLIGLSASKISSQDAGTTRTLSMHIPSLTSNSEIEIPANVQTASIMGLGLLYSGSSHRFISEVLFNELVRPPTDSSQNREGYALAAGFALGLCALAQGSDRGPPIQLAGMNLDEKLCQYMTGGTRPEHRMVKRSGTRSASIGGTSSSNARQSTASQCTKIQESPQLINVDVTGPGACVALILMYLQSHNRSIMQKLEVPHTRYLLEYLRPNMVLLRVTGKNLVGWDWIEPTEEWILENIPEACRTESIMHPSVVNQNPSEDWLRSVYAHAIAGCCFALGIRYAGTGREDIYLIIVQQIQKLESNRNPSEKPFIHHCLLVCIIALACIMSGRGNVDLVNIILAKRKLLAGQYDAQMALNMALGINFLSGGRCSFATTPLAAASLLIALYPRFPTHINDNQFHLQAFRHLHALAAVPRLLEARDVDTGKVCHVPITLTLNHGQVMQLILPAIIPEKEEIESISINTSAYYSVKIDSNMMERALDELVLWVRHRTSYLPQRHKPDQEFQGVVMNTGSGGLNMSTNNAMNVSAMSTTSDLQTSLLRVEQTHNERNIVARSPYESVEVISSEFLSKKPSMLRAVAALKTPSELLWQSLADDNMNGVYVHEYVKSALRCLSGDASRGMDHLTDQLWNLNMLIEHKLFDRGYGATLLGGAQTHLHSLMMNTSSASMADDLESTRVSQYWLDKQETLVEELEAYFPNVLEYIACASYEERLRYLVQHPALCPVLKFLNIYTLKVSDVRDMMQLKQLCPEMPWALVQYVVEGLGGGAQSHTVGAAMDDSGDVIMG